MHARTSGPSRPRRSSGRPLDVAASLVLTVGLIGCAAPAAHAADTPTTAGTTTASAGSSSARKAVEHPAHERTVTAVFTRLERDPGLGLAYKALFTVRLTNTGDAPLTVLLDRLQQHGDGYTTLAVGESKDVGPIENVIDASQLPGGVYRYSASGAAYTPQGERIDADIDVELPVPTWQADRAGQPSTAPTSTPTGTPSSTSTPSTPVTQGLPLAVTATGRFLTRPLELVRVGSPVEFTYTVTNISTADVPLAGGRTLAPGQSVELTKAETLVTAQDMKDGSVTPAAKIAQGTVPDGASIFALGPYDYRLPIPATAPVAAEVPDLDVTVTGTFRAAEG